LFFFASVVTMKEPSNKEVADVGSLYDWPFDLPDQDVSRFGAGGAHLDIGRCALEAVQPV
jgi:hypothetical protein